MSFQRLVMVGCDKHKMISAFTRFMWIMQ